MKTALGKSLFRVTAWGRQTFLGRDSGYVIDRCRQTPAELEGLATYAPLFFSVGVDFTCQKEARASKKGGACLEDLAAARGVCVLGSDALLPDAHVLRFDDPPTHRDVKSG